VSKSDKNLFQDLITDVTPLKSGDEREHQPQQKSQQNSPLRQKSATHFSQTLDNNMLTEDAVSMVSPHSILEYKKSGIQEAVFRKLRLGKYPIQDSLDLHRLTVKQARISVWEFIHQSIKNDFRTIIIIHGKGEYSEPKARLKSFVNAWLHQIDSVLAFHSAIAKQGGTGATYILLKKSPQQKQRNREIYR